ncbi:MAG: ATP-binding protein, partial [Firmicutes bacterium]|nr:ATP-binding protein [Bacillota bacterium]
NMILIAEKNYILENNGYPADYMTNVYKCPECKDSGRIGAKRCSCFNSRLMTKLYEVSNLGNKLEKENFENFDMSFYSDKKEENEKSSPLENMNNILRISYKFVKDFESKNTNLIFYGGAGLGKTFLCSCIAKELIQKGRIVIYVSAFELFDMIEREHFGKDGSEEIHDSLELIENAHLLIIDDLGTEFATKLSVPELFNIVNYRLNNEMSTIISTNLSPKELEIQYSDRLISRIYGNYTVLRFIGEDIRIQKKARGMKNGKTHS